MPLNIADMFEAVADAVPDNEALIVGDRRLTFADLDRRATKLANALAGLGIGPGDHVGLYLTNGTPYLEAMIAAFKLRAVPINVNYRYVEDELRYLLVDADVKVLIAKREYRPRVDAVRADCSDLSDVITVDDGSGEPREATFDYDEFLESGSDVRDFPERSDDDIYIIYTGGTTGMPKGVMWRHEDIFIAGMTGANPAGEPLLTLEALTENAKTKYHLIYFPVAPLIHGAAQLASFISLLGGDTLVFEEKFSGEGTVAAVAREKINTMSIVGDAMAVPIVEAIEADTEGRYDLSSLFIISSAGAIFSTPVKDRLKAVLPNTALLDNYGSTETGYQGNGTESERSSFGAGLAFQMNDRTVVLDEDHNIVEPGSGVTGKVALRRHVPVGYYNDPEKSAATFVTIGGERYSITGDVATLEADGTIKVFGRGSQCINSGGEKVFIEEVENALKTHPAVADCVVVGVPDQRFGERVAALVSLTESGKATEADLQSHSRTSIAGYKVPKEIHVVDTVFRGPNGKADYKSARAIAAELSDKRQSAAAGG